MNKINILFLFLLGLSISAQAQDTLSFVKHTYTVVRTDTTQSINIVDSAYNSGDSLFLKYVSFRAMANGTLLNASQFTSDSLVPGQAGDSLLPNAGNYRALRFTIINNYDSAPPFEITPIGVIIWPVIDQGLTPTGPNDSIYINIYRYALGIPESPLAKMFIFQTTDHLNINFGDAQNLVQQVRIYDILGQSMYSSTADRSKDINTAGWSKAIYLCEITTYAGEKRTIKFRLQ